MQTKGEMIEDWARALCDAPEPRIIADKTEAPCFDESASDVQDYWRSLARTVLAKGLPS